uniref:Ycf63 n=1 Tax=Pterocladia lucida TaxID=31408 RepID=A0A6M3WVV0_PTELU|nr:Ycf63 [Pterocladia lucida]
MLDIFCLIEQMKLTGPSSLPISIITAFFVSMVFTLQVVKEILYLNTVNIIGSILALAFIRELSPVLTSVILIGRVASSYTAELATMKVTEQLNALYLLEVNPVLYLVLPRLIAFVFMLPILNIIAFITSIASSIFVCFVFYEIDPYLFIGSAISAVSLSDIMKSSCKMIIFSCMITLISCYYGLSARGGAYGVGRSTTNAVVSCLLTVFMMDFVLSYLMFGYLDSSIRSFS